MHYFDKTNKFSNGLLISGIIFLVVSIKYLFSGTLDQHGDIFFTIFFLLSAFSFIVAIALKCVVKDAKEELDAIKKSL